MNHSFGPWSSATTEPPAATGTPEKKANDRRLLPATARRLAAFVLVFGAAAVVAWQPLVPDSQAQSKDPPKTPGLTAPEFLPELSATERQIMDVLERKVTFNFDETPLRDVVGHLQENSDINVVLDKPGLEVVSVDADTPITLEVKDIRMGAALKLLLQPLSLTYQLRNDVLLITDEEEAAKDLTIRVYPVTDLFAQEDDSEPLIEAIINTVYSDTWEDNGGTGTINYIPATGALVISQHSEVHKRILDVLRALRRAKEFRRTVFAK